MSAPHSVEKDAAAEEHLRFHLYDGAWHDGCQFCLHRRRYGGNGVTSAAALPSPLPPAETDGAR